jgi:ribonuclease-3
MTIESNGPRVEADLAELETVLGHRFVRQELLQRALTHRSVAHAKAVGGGTDKAGGAGHNERLEFLGDAVLGLVIAEALFELHPGWQEGELTRVRAQLVSRHHLAQVAMVIDLGRHLRLSRNEDRGGLRRKATVLSNTMEAVLAALFLDGGMEPVRAFAHRCVMGEAAEQLARELRSGAALGNYKSALQEYLQAAHLGTPVYRVKGESGPDHRKRFLVEVRLKTGVEGPGTPLARGVGSTKRKAEQEAARRALAKLTAPSAGKGTNGQGVTDEEMDERSQDGTGEEEQPAP